MLSPTDSRYGVLEVISAVNTQQPNIAAIARILKYSKCLRRLIARYKMEFGAR